MAWALRILSHLEVSGFRIYRVSEGLRFRVSSAEFKVPFCTRFLSVFRLQRSWVHGATFNGFEALEDKSPGVSGLRLDAALSFWLSFSLAAIQKTQQMPQLQEETYSSKSQRWLGAATK